MFFKSGATSSRRPAGFWVNINNNRLNYFSSFYLNIFSAIKKSNISSIFSQKSPEHQLPIVVFTRKIVVFGPEKQTERVFLQMELIYAFWKHDTLVKHN